MIEPWQAALGTVMVVGFVVLVILSVFREWAMAALICVGALFVACIGVGFLIDLWSHVSW